MYRCDPARAWPPKDLPEIRIGRLGLLDGAKIAVMDQTLSPPVTSTAYIGTLAIENIDTTDPAARSDVRMRARLDQAEVTVDGWALPFQPKPDFELRAKVSELVLPSVNPYVGPEVGLDIVEGKLIANAQARADTGQLKGEIRAKVIDLVPTDPRPAATASPDPSACRSARSSICCRTRMVPSTSTCRSKATCCLRSLTIRT